MSRRRDDRAAFLIGMLGLCQQPKRLDTEFAKCTVLAIDLMEMRRINLIVVGSVAVNDEEPTGGGAIGAPGGPPERAATGSCRLPAG